MEDKITCEICETPFNTIGSLSQHIRFNHEISPKDYYDSFIKKENDGQCLNCGDKTTFYNIGKRGYGKYCSKDCRGEHRTKIAEKKNITERNNFEYNCDYCNERFRTLNGLNVHKSIIHSEAFQKEKEEKTKAYLYDCQICGMKLKSHSSMSQHLVRLSDHPNQKEYYERFLIKDDEDSCRTCGSKTRFRGLKKGYSDFCSAKCVASNIETINKIKRTVKEVFGDRHPINSPDSVQRMAATKRSIHESAKKESYEKLLDLDWITEQYKTKTCDEIGKLLDLSGTTIRRRLNENNFKLYRKKSSFAENEILLFIEVELKINNIVENKRKTIRPLELDIYLPDHNLAIEFDGIYWHGEQKGKGKNYHLNKTERCEEKGIQLLHIFENEWTEKQDIWKSIIRNKLGSNSTRVFARKCEVREVDSKTANNFLDTNHLQGRDRSSIRLGLYYEEELVSLFTVGKSRYNKKYQYEIHRFCNKLNTSVVGGFGKLYKYFERNYKPESIITYADKRYSNGKLYDNFFDYSHDSKPNYFYRIGYTLASRIQFQKHKLADKLDLFDKSLSEYQNMLLNGYDRIWDCGNKVYCKNT